MQGSPLEGFEKHNCPIELRGVSIACATVRKCETLTRKVVLATVGSLGDLHPFIALSLALKDCGLNVVLACATEYRSKVESAGIAFHPLRPGFEEIERDLGLDRAQLTREVIEDSGFLFRRLVLPYVRCAYEDMMEAAADADLILTSSLAFGARLAAEKRGIPGWRWCCSP